MSTSYARLIVLHRKNFATPPDKDFPKNRPDGLHTLTSGPCHHDIYIPTHKAPLLECLKKSNVYLEHPNPRPLL